MRYTVTVERATTGQMAYTDVEDWGLNADETILLLHSNLESKHEEPRRMILVPLGDDVLSIEIVVVATDSSEGG